MICPSLVIRSASLFSLLLLFAAVGVTSGHAGIALPSEYVLQLQGPSPGSHVLADTTKPRIVQPGAPGQPPRVLTPDERTSGDRPGHIEADVRFMQGMILHHAQALEMTALVAERSEREAIRRIAHRMERSQGDEIALMARWLEERHAPLPPLSADVKEALEYEYESGPDQDGHAHHGHHGDEGHRHHDHGEMHGMLSDEQMAQLAEASGDEFDRLFLQFMIFHHEGAITMVEELFATPGAAQDSVIDTFAAHVESDQRVEIARMLRMLGTL